MKWCVVVTVLRAHDVQKESGGGVVEWAEGKGLVWK